MTGSGAPDPYEVERPRGLRRRLSDQAEETIGRLADDLLENPLVNSALQQAVSAREKMAQAQESAMEALNLPSASNVDKLARRLRSISQRLEEIEDGVEKLANRMEAVSDSGKEASTIVQRLERLDSRMDELGRDVAALRRELPAGAAVTEPPARAVIPEG
jgi:hypothetical protein